MPHAIFPKLDSRIGCLFDAQPHYKHQLFHCCSVFMGNENCCVSVVSLVSAASLETTSIFQKSLASARIAKSCVLEALRLVAVTTILYFREKTKFEICSNHASLCVPNRNLWFATRESSHSVNKIRHQKNKAPQAGYHHHWTELPSCHRIHMARHQGPWDSSWLCMSSAQPCVFWFSHSWSKRPNDKIQVHVQSPNFHMPCQKYFSKNKASNIVKHFSRIKGERIAVSVRI